MRRRLILISVAVLALALRGSCAAEVHELTFPSGGATLKALLLTPEGGTTDTLLVYLHGNPGSPLEPARWLVDPVLDAGVAVFQFNYRGLWGNAGDFNLTNAIGDLRSALSFLTAPDALLEYGVTAERIVLFGYSFGTAVALSGAHDDDRVAAIASFAPCDHGFFGAEFADPESPLREFLDAVTEMLFGEDRPIQQDAAIFTDDLVDNSAEYRFPPTALALRDKRLLFLVGLDDEVCFAEDHFFPLYRALDSVSHPSTDVVVLPMDHGAKPLGRDAVGSKVAEWVASSGRVELATLELSNERLQAFAASYTSAWNSGDPKRVAQHYSEDGSLAINGGEPAIGREALAQVAESFMTGFPDMELSFDGLGFEDGRIQYHWTFRGTNTGPGGTGHRVDFSGFESWRFDADGLVADSLGNFDAEEYQRQLEVGVGEPHEMPAKDAQPAPPPACSEVEEYRQLDFWVGEWDVFSGDQKVGTNVIAKILDGCAVSESWTDSRGNQGESLFYFNPREATWKQVWVTERSKDNGETWSTGFDAVYRRLRKEG